MVIKFWQYALAQNIGMIHIKLIANRKTQELNSKGIKEGTKRARKKTAKELPEGITQNMLPKYVVYYKECYNKEKNLYREFFKIEKHPKIKKPINSSKSNKKTIKENE